MKKFLIAIGLSFPVSLSAQLYVDTADNLNTMVQEVFLNYGLQVTNISYTGASNTIGNFAYVGSSFGLNSGLILTTGELSGNQGPQGPNNNGGSGVSNGMPGNAMLDNVLSGVSQTYDASVLEFDFIPSGDSVFFNYVFASEEYLEYVDAGFNDIFALFISGPGIPGVRNIALLPNHAIVSIDNVNTIDNSTFYVDNGDGSLAPFNTSDTYLQFDGFTTPLVAKEAVQIGQTYHLTIAVADVGDGILDSGIFLEAESLRSNNGLNADEKTLEAFRIYPNPAQNELSWTLPGKLNGTASVLDLNGKRLISAFSLSTQKMDISMLEKGIYFLELDSNAGKITQKFVVE